MKENGLGNFSFPSPSPSPGLVTVAWSPTGIQYFQLGQGLELELELELEYGLPFRLSFLHDIHLLSTKVWIESDS